MSGYEVGVFVDLRFAWNGFISQWDKPLTCESELTKTPIVFRRRRKRWRRRIADVVWNAIRRLVSGPSKSCYCLRHDPFTMPQRKNMCDLFLLIRQG